MNARVLFMVDDFPHPAFGGTEAQFWLLFGALDKARWRPRVVTLRPSTFLARNVPPEQYESLAITSLKSPLSWWKAWRCARRARREGFRVAHLYLNDVSVLMPPLLRLAGIKVIVSRRDLGFWYTPGLLAVLRRVRSYVDCVVANCEAVKDVVCERERYAPESVEVILNGFARPSSLPFTSRYRQAAGVPPGALVFGMVANLRPLKRVEDAISALARLPWSTTPSWLVVAGEDRPYGARPGTEVLMEHAAAQGVADRVRFVGAVSDPWPFLQELDVFLSCSDTEGLSNSIIEAMAAGKPVVASSVGGTPELIEEGTTGYCYRARDVAGLAGAMERLAMDDALRGRLGVAGAASVARRMSVAVLVAQHERLYERLCGEGSANEQPDGRAGR